MSETIRLYREIRQHKTVTALDGTSYEETTLTGMAHLKGIADNVHSRGGKVIMSVDIIMPWIR